MRTGRNYQPRFNHNLSEQVTVRFSLLFFSFQLQPREMRCVMCSLPLFTINLHSPSFHRAVGLLLFRQPELFVTTK